MTQLGDARGAAGERPLVLGLPSADNAFEADMHAASLSSLPTRLRAGSSAALIACRFVTCAATILAWWTLRPTISSAHTSGAHSGLVRHSYLRSGPEQGDLRCPRNAALPRSPLRGEAPGTPLAETVTCNVSNFVASTIVPVETFSPFASRHRLPAAGLAKLPGDPLGRRMRRHAQP